jgi:flagellar P-ring protein FlgI
MRLVPALFACVVWGWPAAARADRLLDLCDVVGVRGNQLLGYGVVVGLNGTGDDVSAPFAMQSLRALLRRLGVQIDQAQLRLRNVAAVLVTADIHAFARSGSRLDVTVSSAGNARSLQGGVLAQTPLKGADMRVYAVAQGSLVVGGFSASGAAGGGVQAGSTNSARIPSGATVEREIETHFVFDGKLTLSLRSPNFVTAQRVVEAVNQQLGSAVAVARDAGSVEVALPDAQPGAPVQLLSRLAVVQVSPDVEARVVVNERTGTVVAGGDVALLPVAIAQGGITVKVRETQQVSQPGPLSAGTTAVVKQSDVEAEEVVPGVTYLPGAATLAEVAQALSTLGVSPRELASILQALRTAGALRAEIVVQ